MIEKDSYKHFMGSWSWEWFVTFTFPAYPYFSRDKQFVRNYLLFLDWDQKPPAPSLPEDIIQKTSERYIEAYRRLTGKDFTS